MAEADWLSKMALRHAERLASAGKFEQADHILRSINPEDDQTKSRSKTLSESVKGELLSQLNARFPDRSVYPRRLVTNAALRQEGLRSFDAYIFSQLDGGTCIDDLIALTPASEIETLAALRKLIDLQLVALDAPREEASRRA